MKYKLYLLVCSFSAFFALLYFTRERAITRTFFVQAPLALVPVKQLHDTMLSGVEEILIQELGTKEYTENNQKWALFFFKPRQAITLYYLYDVREDGVNAILSAGDSVKGVPAPQNVSLTTNLQFFGDESSQVLEPVVLIDDSKSELLGLHEKIKSAAHTISGEYQSKNVSALYDLAKSDRFAYKPHLSLGFLRHQAIKKLVKDPANAQEIVERIKKRILEVLSKELGKILAGAGAKITFDRVGVYDAQKKSFIKDWSFLTKK